MISCWPRYLISGEKSGSSSERWFPVTQVWETRTSGNWHDGRSSNCFSTRPAGRPRWRNCETSRQLRKWNRIGPREPAASAASTATCAQQRTPLPLREDSAYTPAQDQSLQRIIIASISRVTRAHCVSSPANITPDGKRRTRERGTRREDRENWIKRRLSKNGAVSPRILDESSLSSIFISLRMNLQT